MARRNSTTVGAHAFRKLIQELPRFSALQIEELLDSAISIRRTRVALAEIEHRGETSIGCPHCGSVRRQKWGHTRTHAQRYCCTDCRRSYSGLTGSAVCGLHRHDLFLEVIRDMFSDRPRSCRKLAVSLGKTKDTIWRWRMLILRAIGDGSDRHFSGIVEVDETYQRESRKGSREWSRHQGDPGRFPRPPRHQWHVYKSGRIKMQRGLSRWQLPLLTISDRSGKIFLDRIEGRNSAVIEAALAPVIATDAVICTDGLAAYARFSQKHGVTHHVLSNKPGARVVAQAFHIQNVNAMHARYVNFIRPFRGPASKYLCLYLRWFLLQARLDAPVVFRTVLDGRPGKGPPGDPADGPRPLPAH